MYPYLGKAGSAYARTVKPVHGLPGVLPDPSTIFDGIFAPLTQGRLEGWANSKQLYSLEMDLQRSILAGSPACYSPSLQSLSMVRSAFNPENTISLL